MLTAVGLLAACGSTPDDTGSLEPQAFQAATTTKLPGGGRVSVGSPDGHRVVAQWQAEGSTGWSEPTTVYTEPEQLTHDISVTAARDTVAIDADFWTEKVLDDDYAPRHTAQVICRERECAPGHRTPDGTLSHTDLAASGRQASFELAGDDVLLWDDGTFSTETVVGLPEDASSEMFPDGSFGAIAPEAHGDACRYRLLTSTVGEAAYVSRAVSADHVAVQPCSISGIELTKDTATVYVEDIADSVEFKRTGDDAWTVEEPKAPLEGYPDTEGQSSLANITSGRSDGSTLSLGSPDGRRIMAQLRPDGSKEWSAPVQVATAPTGTTCRFLSSERDGLAVMAMVSCYRSDRRFRLGTTDDPDAGLAIATADGTTFDVETLVRPAVEVGRGDDHLHLFQGTEASYTWSPKTSMRRVDLPSDPRRDALMPADDGEIIRVSGNVTGAKACRPSFQVAKADATSWPAPTPMPDVAPTTSDDDGCVATLHGGGDSFEAEFWYAWTGTLERRDGTWVAVASGG